MALTVYVREEDEKREEIKTHPFCFCMCVRAPLLCVNVLCLSDCLSDRLPRVLSCKVSVSLSVCVCVSEYECLSCRVKCAAKREKALVRLVLLS